MEFVIITGMSGAGKSRAVDAMEDMGFFCVDNLPAKLILTFYELSLEAHREHVAIVTDTRGGDLFSGFLETMDSMKTAGYSYKILFLDASDYVLINRFKETRRKHPLADPFLGSVEQAVQLERDILRTVRIQADYIVDTSSISPAQLKSRLSSIFLNESGETLSIHCMSFGFKYGVPAEADLVFDVRCFPNPFYIEELRELTGLDEAVREYVINAKETQGFLLHLFSMIDYMLPLYREEGKSQLVVAIGCTGGHHRSVAIAQALYSHLQEKKQKRVSVTHRDIHR